MKTETHLRLLTFSGTTETKDGRPCAKWADLEMGSRVPVVKSNTSGGVIKITVPYYIPYV